MGRPARLSAASGLPQVDLGPGTGVASLDVNDTLADAILGTMPGVFILLDDARRIVRTNAALAGLPGAPFLELVGKADHERAQRFLAAATNGGATAELRLAVPAGDAVFALTARRLTIDGAPRLLITGADISEQRRLEGQLVQARKSESLGRLARGVAHDFNNVLAAVMSYAELILMDSAADDPRRADVETIRQAALRAGELTRQILVFSRVQTVQPRAMDLNALVQSLDKLMRRVLGEDIELVTMLGENLPLVEADPGQVEAALVTEVVAAREGTGQGASIIVRTAAGPRGVQLSVGREGATPFVLELPRAEGPLPDDVRPAVATRGTETIIVAEDSDVVRKGIAAMLGSRGFTVLPAANGEEALRLARTHPGKVDLVLADVVMPRMTALELDSGIRETRPETPIIFMSGYADDAVSRGIVKPAGFIQKPFSAEALVKKVREVLDT